jgi:miniconductance mechanosensitive channel
MREIVYSWIQGINWHQQFIKTGDLTLRFAALFAICYLTGKIAGKIIISITEKSAEGDLLPFNRSLLKKDAVKRFTMMFPFILIYFASEVVFSDTPSFLRIFNRVLFSILIVLGIYAINAFLDAVEHYYQHFEAAKKNPIKGYLQLIKIFITIIGIIIITASFVNRSPWGIISGFGAMTALVMLIFRDWIQGLIASIQINANNLVVIGDSIEIEKYGVNGEVIDISLSTVKVKNWDNTISMIPAYSLITETFKNWHGVKESGGRRIKRVIYIDINSINLPDKKILKNINSIEIMKDSSEFKELSRAVRKKRRLRLSESGITNIGLFRIYVERYLATHTGIDSEKKLMAKLLEPTAYGIPLQIYVFTNVIDVVEYEKTVAEIFEHLIAVIGEFGLKLFQNPSGTDVK